MDYREHLRKPLSKLFVDQLALEVYTNPSDFEIVYKLIFDQDEKVAWRSAWACQKISEKYPTWFSDKQFYELAALAISTNQGGLQRGCLSVLNNISLPNEIPVDFINSCFEWMVSPKSPIAVQALSMKLLHKICLQEPGFTVELIAYLENIDPNDYSAGFKSTRKNVLKALINK